MNTLPETSLSKTLEVPTVDGVNGVVAKSSIVSPTHSSSTTVNKSTIVDDTIALRRQKNREAARKCRDKKRRKDTAKMSELQENATKLEERTSLLQKEVENLYVQRNAWVIKENSYITLLNNIRDRFKKQTEYINQLEANFANNFGYKKSSGASIQNHTLHNQQHAQNHAQNHAQQNQQHQNQHRQPLLPLSYPTSSSLRPSSSFNTKQQSSGHLQSSPSVVSQSSGHVIPSFQFPQLTELSPMLQQPLHPFVQKQHNIDNVDYASMGSSMGESIGVNMGTMNGMDILIDNDMSDEMSSKDSDASSNRLETIDFDKLFSNYK